MNNNSLQHIVESASEQGHTLEIISTIKSGKEAEVFAAELDGTIVALKVYKDPEQRTFRNAKEYVVGKYYKKPSERKAVAKGNAFSKKLLHSNWVEREFFLLKKLYSLGAILPEPLLLLGNAICMEYLGTKDSVAPRLCDVELTQEEMKGALKSILESISIFWEAGIVHADLSEFNILWHKDSPYIIDFPQAINRKTHPSTEVFLERDLKNILHFFGKKLGINLDIEAYKQDIIEA